MRIFQSFVASEAADHSTAEKRKILNGEDVVWAMESLGFDHYSEVLRIYLARYRMVRAISSPIALIGRVNLDRL